MMKDGIAYYDTNMNVEIEKGFKMDEKIECSEHPSSGFQIGGYYTNMHFVTSDITPNCCLEWVLHSDGEFPTDDEKEMITFHICDFRQIERWVKFWGNVLRKKGVIEDNN